MKINIISVGKIKESYFKDAVEEYARRLQKYCNLNRTVLQDEKLLESIPDTVLKDREGQRITKALSQNSFKIAMTERGKQFSSEKLAAFIKSLEDKGYQEISFIIGGALGLSENVLNEADFKLSLSELTLPHQMAYLFLTEQIYRSFKIINNEPYHKT